MRLNMSKTADFTSIEAPYSPAVAGQGASIIKDKL